MEKEPSKSRLALELMDKTPGMTPYAAAKALGVSSTAVYSAMEARTAKAQRAACPTCGTLLKAGVEPFDPVQAYKDRLLELLDDSAAQANQTGKLWLSEIAERVKKMT